MGEPTDIVKMRSPGGGLVDVPAAEVGKYLPLGFHVESTGEQTQRIVESEREGRLSGAKHTVAAAITGGLRGATFGASDVVLGIAGGDEGFRNLRELKEAHPTASMGGEVIGAIATAIPSGGTSLLSRAPAAAASRLGARIAQTAEGASTLTKVGRGFLGGAAEGALQGVGDTVSQAALADQPLTLEQIGASLSSNVLFGGATGGAAGAAAKGLEIGLGRAKRAIDDFKTRGDVADALPDDLATMDVKQLRAARDVEVENIKTARAAEKQGIETARVAERQGIADDLRAHHEAIDTEKAWLATKDSSESEIRTIGKQMFNANRPLRNMLDNPKYLAEKPQTALSALQKQEHAFEQMLRVDGRLRRTFDAVEDELDVNKLTAAERDAVDVYTGGEHSAINAHLRGKKHWGGDVGADHELTKGTVGEAVKGLDSLISRSTVAEPMTVFRGVPAKQYRVGQTITDKGFGSVSLNRGTADGFATGTGKPGRVLEIEVPAGAKALNASQIMGGAESEFILPRGAKLQITEVTDDVVRARLKTAKGAKAGATDGSARAAALDTVPAALERNRALQARIRETTSDIKLATPEATPRLQQIEEARDLLSAGKGEKTIAEQMLQGAVFSAAAGGVTALAGDSPLAGVAGMLAPLVGARAAKLVTGGVFGRIGSAAGELAKRSSRAVDALLSASKHVSRLAPPLASKTLTAVRYASGDDKAAKKPDLAKLYHARSSELRSQTQYAADGSIEMRPDARAAVAAKLTPIAAVDQRAADQLETIAARRVEFLASKLPRRPDIGGIPTSAADRWQPSEMEMRQFARYVAAVEDPVGVIERVADGTVTPSDTEVMKQVYPEMYADITQQIVSRLPELRAGLPYRQRLALSRFTGEPIDASMHPRILAVLQAQHAQEPGTDGGIKAPTPQPKFGAFGSPSKHVENEKTPSQRRTA